MTRRFMKALDAALRKHLKTGKRPRLPEGAAPLWDAFCALSATRTFGEAGMPNAITFAEIEAFTRLMRWPLEPHHVEVIQALDLTWRLHTIDAMQAGRGGAKASRAPKADLSLELFDALGLGL